MEDNDKIREVDMDEIREKVDGTTSEFVDNSLSDKLSFVQHYESREDYWFGNKFKYNL